MKPNQKGVLRILNAFRYSLAGFSSAFKTETAFRQDILFCFVAGIVSFFIPVDTVSFLLMFFSLFFILFAELVNTAIEALSDRVSEEFHPLSKKAKDIGSLLVLMAFINVFVVWGVVLYNLYKR